MNRRFATLSEIYSERGVAGLWKGVVVSLVLVANPAIQFAAYEWLKNAQVSACLRLDFITFCDRSIENSLALLHSPLLGRHTSVKLTLHSSVALNTSFLALWQRPLLRW